MGLKAKHMQVTLVLVIGLARIGAAADDDLALPGCSNTCGSVSIPYPFGIGKSFVSGGDCFLEEAMELSCNGSTLYRGRGNVQILNISLDGKMEMLLPISQLCKDEPRRDYMDGLIRLPAFPISSRDNKFVTVGCDSYGYLNNFNNSVWKSSTGCLTRCNSIDDVPNDGNCTGVGCCQVDIPPKMKYITVDAYSFNNFQNTSYFSNCSYSFVVKNNKYTFSKDHLKGLPFKDAPLVVDWMVGYTTCNSSQSIACKNHSKCEDSITGSGYLCKCKTGYEGNPYHPNGCRDINECERKAHNCISSDNCLNTDGSFECYCPKGQVGNGKLVGGGCQPKQQRDVLFTKVSIGGGVGLIAMFVGCSWLYFIYQKQKLIKIKEKFFWQNGGILLKQQLSTSEDSSQVTTIFSANQLMKATKNYDDSLIIGKGGYGTVFKGFLPDNRVVAIKKSKVVDHSQIEQFINEVVILSQINHRNVVKLLGCCLETEVPSLVYEFVNNGTLFNYLHNEGKTTNVCWKTRLRIAAEAAGALSYLHSAASIPIIHRDVKSTNILLDNTYTAKVSDFGASRLVPLNQTEVATMVQGTIGYLDPEYLQTSQLTEKSDVYSFGVVLVELLTGEKPLSFDRPEEERSLAMHFLSCLKEDRLFEVFQINILNEENKHEIMEVAILAAKCLNLRGDERPSMKEVAMELERIRVTNKHPWISTDQNFEEAQYLLPDAYSIHKHGDSSDLKTIGYDSLRDHVLIDFDDGR